MQESSSIAVEHDFDTLQDIATKLRIHSIEMTNASKSGHPTSCSSIAEVMAVLFFDVSGMRYDPTNPRSKHNDKLILSKGHAAPILYACWAENGFLTKESLLTLRKIDSDIEGHPTPKLEFVDVATGSLGQGLSVGCGMAYCSKNLEKSDNRYYVIIGDGESAEGSIWEAMNFASYYSLDNLVCVFDVNRLGQSQATCLEHDVETYKKRCEAFGWHTIIVDGHSLKEICSALETAKTIKNKPVAIVAKTMKGKSMTVEVEDVLNWHGKPLGKQSDEALNALKDSLKDVNAKMEPTRPKNDSEALAKHPEFKIPTTSYKLGECLATRNAYGEAMKSLGEIDNGEFVIGLDGDTKNSTMAGTFHNAFPERFVECFIAEQNVVGVATGFGTRGKVPFCSAFAAFFSRAFDQIRMGAISQMNVKFSGSHCGVSIGEDGPSQMALEDIAMFRSIPGSMVLYPSDAVSTTRAVELAANNDGIVFIRTSRPSTPVVYENDEKFELGKCKVIQKSDSDKITVVGAGVTLHEANKAYELLKTEGINIRVIDIFSIKPIDKAGLLAAAKETNNLILTVEDHYYEGGILEAVSSALATEDVKVHGVAVSGVARSGSGAELLDLFGLSGAKIAEKVKTLL